MNAIAGVDPLECGAWRERKRLARPGRYGGGGHSHCSQALRTGGTQRLDIAVALDRCGQTKSLLARHEDPFRLSYQHCITTEEGGSCPLRMRDLFGTRRVLPPAPNTSHKTDPGLPSGPALPRRHRPQTPPTHASVCASPAHHQPCMAKLRLASTPRLRPYESFPTTPAEGSVAGLIVVIPQSASYTPVIVFSSFNTRARTQQLA